ncbi:terminase small subunit [Burkholderia stagnalis]|uniref:terminase small subunit n=1 Tax=Burkholderia stagnalis TaxID=1503054 RepID=UPI00075ED545|nr:terminase small subunit [Burkholderia stagnalis]KVL90770.1 terminase [Burkholderia stagnalis]KVL93730.1 terminase [Burkholderia stagnalis]KVM02153.1 terminase [Burkholderia stagnalis]
MSKNSKKLNSKHERFVGEYLIDLNASAAARRAGYSERTAGQMGFELLKKPEIAEAIAEAMKAREKRTEITQDRVLQELARIAFFDIRRLYNEDGTMKRPDQLDDDAAAVLSGLDVIEQQTAEADAEGNLTFTPTLTKKAKVFDKNTALTLAMRHLGMLRDKVELGLPPGGALVRVEFVEAEKAASQGGSNE